MAKRGRPKKLEKASNRVHSVVLTQKAELIYRFICGREGTKWFSAWVVKRLCEEFPIENEEEFWLKEMLRREKEMHEKQDHFAKARDKYLELKKLSLESESDNRTAETE